MSMPAVSFGDDPFVAADDLKMPERAAHRQAVDLIALAATQLLGPGARIFRDLNWYPDDERGPVAPDVMVVPAEAVEPRPRSYRQDRRGGPPPDVVVEIPSETDSFVSLRTKARRYQRLGTTLYVVTVDDGDVDVLRLGVDDREFVPWMGREIPELGGLRLDAVDDTLTATLPDGTTATTDDELVAAARRAEDAARLRVGALEAQLRALGVESGEPGEPEPPPLA